MMAEATEVARAAMAEVAVMAREAPAGGGAAESVAVAVGGGAMVMARVEGGKVEVETVLALSERAVEAAEATHLEVGSRAAGN